MKPMIDRLYLPGALVYSSAGSNRELETSIQEYA